MPLREMGCSAGPWPLTGASAPVSNGRWIVIVVPSPGHCRRAPRRQTIDDPKDRGEAKSVPRSLVGEERLKDALYRCRAHADARIGNLQAR